MSRLPATARNLALAALLVGCGSRSGLPVRTLEIEGHKATVEVAATTESRTQGLMFRDQMGPDEGMLFIYPDEKPRSFWMKDTRIPLSIAYIDRKGTIVRIADMKPFETKGTPSLYPATYALEMNQGWFASKGIEKGAKVSGLPTDIAVE